MLVGMALRPPNRCVGALVALPLFLLVGCWDEETIPPPAVPADTGSPDSGPVTLEPGHFNNPLVRLKRLQGVVSHLHVDEVRYRASDAKLFQCAYTFAVVNAKDPANMAYMAENLKHKVPGDTRSPGCIHLAADGDIVYTTHRGNLSNPNFISGWDISKVDPASPSKLLPVQLPALQEPNVAYEGIDVANGNIFVALNDKGLGVYRRDATTNEISRIGVVGGFTNAWGVVARDKTVFVTDGAGGLVTVDATDPTAPTVLGSVVTGGVAHGLVVDGNIAYVAAGSAGVVVVDVSDLAAPKVIAHIATPGPAERIDYSANKIFVAAWNDARVYDVTTPTLPRFIGAVRLTEQISYPDDGRPPIDTRNLGVAGFGDVMFIGNWYILYSYKVHPDRRAPNILLPEDVNMLDFGPVAGGASKTQTLQVTNQGTAPLTLFETWTESRAFTVSPKQLRLEPGETMPLTLIYTASTGTTRDTSLLHLQSDDPAQPVRDAFLVGNQPGVSVGKPLPETKMTLLDGTTSWSSTSEKVKGNVLLLSYFATF
jgi:glutamine cyclotransferase